MKKPHHHYSHRNVVGIDCIPDHQNRIEVIEKIGEGSFGQVYKVFDKETSRLLVLKKAKEEDDPTIKEEAHIMNELSNSSGFKKVVQNSEILGKNLLMNCLGVSLGTVMRKRKQMNVFSMKKLALQILPKLEQLHSHKYVHRDLKPDNIVIGDKMDSHSAYLIDFGLVTSFRSKPSKRWKIYNGVVGTAKFCSIASHQGYEQFPRDDLESLGYIFLFFIEGKLPWGQIKSENEEQLFQQILNIKKNSSIDTLSAGYNSLRLYFTKIKELKVTDKIDYKYFLKLFQVGQNGQNLCFDFCEDCWVRKKQSSKNKEIEQQPKPSSIRISITD